MKTIGELNYFDGTDGISLNEFTIEDIIKAIDLMNGDDISGVDIDFSNCGEEICILSVGGGEKDKYVCLLHKAGEEYMLLSSGNKEEILEIVQDFGCDVQTGIFPGNYVSTYDEIIEVTKEFYKTKKMDSKHQWIKKSEMNVYPWEID